MLREAPAVPLIHHPSEGRDTNTRNDADSSEELRDDLFVRVWWYRVRPDLTKEFERVYGAAGDWAKLFERAAGYRGTELFRSTDSPGDYVTVDRWDSAGSWQNFLQLFGAEYRALDQRCDSLTESEKRVSELVQTPG